MQSDNPPGSQYIEYNAYSTPYYQEPEMAVFVAKFWIQLDYLF